MAILLSIFLGSFHRPIPVRCNWSVFARKMHSTSEFAKIVLSKCVWNIWIDVKLLPDDVFFHCLVFSLYRYSASVCKRHGFCFCQLISCQTCYTAGGGCMVWQSSTNEDTAFQWWYDEGTPLSRTCFIFGHGMWLTQEPPCRFQTTCFQFSRLTRFSQFVKVGTSWLSWNEGSASNSLHLALAMAMVASWCFLGSFHRPTPVRYSWSVFARKMHSTSEFAKIVLSKCVIHAWVVMVAWTLRGIPFQVGERSNDLISEFTFFNLVIV